MNDLTTLSLEFFAPLGLFAQAGGGGSNSAIITFAIYIVLVMVLAGLSHRLLQSKSFMSEYFLGSRSLGVWAFALTFAATSSSGGSFIGFPSLVYTHGWVVALWIGSYMVVPIFTMGLLGKRINQVARKTGAITIPDVLRDRFDSPGFGGLATVLIVFFMTFNLIAQFKGGSNILQTLLADVPLFHAAKVFTSDTLAGVPFFGAADAGYFLCLLVFTAAVVVYTAYGGFRAVVWTDVLQGVVMVAGVLIMLPMAIYLVGGMEKATKEIARMTPPRAVSLLIETDEPLASPLVLAKNSWLVSGGEGENRRVFRLAAEARIKSGETTAQVKTDEAAKQHIPAIEITFAKHIASARPTTFTSGGKVVSVHQQVVPEEQKKKTGYDGDGQAGVYMKGPGIDKSSADGFLPLGLAISFFFMWNFSGAGQPSNMVRLMAFKDSNTLRRAIFTVAIYYTLIYFPLVVIFMCAKVLLPGWETDSDRIMPEMAKALTLAMNMPWLAGLLVAAPFAAVMSTMDSFLLMISSALVRDVYQRNINPDAPEKTIKRLTYVVTVVVGLTAMLAAVSPPQFLQDIIVFTGSGLSTSFLAPVSLALYWPRFNRQGAIAGMLSGFLTHMLLYTVGFFESGELEPLQLFGFHPFMVGALASAVVSVVVALTTSPPPEHLVRKFFYRD